MQARTSLALAVLERQQGAQPRGTVVEHDLGGMRAGLVELGEDEVGQVPRRFRLVGDPIVTRRRGGRQPFEHPGPWRIERHHQSLPADAFQLGASPAASCAYPDALQLEPLHARSSSRASPPGSTAAHS